MSLQKKIQINGWKIGIAVAILIYTLQLSYQSPVLIPTTMSNPKVYFDMSIGGKAAGRVVMELRADVV